MNKASNYIIVSHDEDGHCLEAFPEEEGRALRKAEEMAKNNEGTKYYVYVRLAGFLAVTETKVIHP